MGEHEPTSTEPDPVVSIREVTSVKDSGQCAPITGLSHFQLLVSDVGASARWYRAALGLVPFAEDLDIGYVALKHRDAKIVVVLTKARGPRERSPGSAEVLDHLAFAVPDGDALTSWAEHLTSVGIDHAGVVLENGHPSLQLRDPDGVAIELVAP
jgi:glyoxylase I family protein